MNEEKKLEDMSFEEAMSKLEELVKSLEEGNLDLESSLKVYEEAVLLRQRCRDILEKSERRVMQIMEGEEGLQTEDFR